MSRSSKSSNSAASLGRCLHCAARLGFMASMTLVDFLWRGGPVMAVLLGCSVSALAIVLLKSWQFLRWLRPYRVGFVDVAVELIEGGRRDEALALLSGFSHPVAELARTAVEVGGDPRFDAGAAQAEVARVGNRLLRRLEGWLRWLAGIAQLCPLLGLLGTVLGMIEAFMRIEQAGAVVDPGVLSGGIWQALLTTAFGLTIAIPAMAAYYLFEGIVDRVSAAMKDAGGRVLAACGKAALEEVTLEVASVERVARGV